MILEYVAGEMATATEPLLEAGVAMDVVSDHTRGGNVRVESPCFPAR